MLQGHLLESETYIGGKVEAIESGERGVWRAVGGPTCHPQSEGDGAGSEGASSLHLRSLLRLVAPSCSLMIVLYY